ncbi:BRO family, N-terminal domain [Seinonella peptonophila]|uniref:BRO family, N-terminal domain n=1 Tax=Seinonella peptonophila TaxID=112248 RepID=A0A1M4VBX2_9BACL|nr:BRO family protein [Seinonella peptonophila]SHE66459.1 BRO family, N-terminal domain [Seinonella peptonophila]
MENNIIELHDGSKVKVVSEVDFEFKGLKLPAMVDESEEFWFLAKDVADVIGLKRHATALDKLDEDEKGIQTLDTLGGKQKVSVVKEPALYKWVLRASSRNKPHIHEFQRWVLHEVLPSIRKHGIYILEERIKELEPKDIAKILLEIDPTIRHLEIDGVVYVAATDAKKHLGYKSTGAIVYRIKENENMVKQSGIQKILYINDSGLRIVLDRSRKEEATTIAKQANLNVVREVPEATVTATVKAAFQGLYEIDLQKSFYFEGSDKQTDIFLPEYKIALEIDEDDHKDRDQDYEVRREGHMRNVLGWHVLRTNPHEKGYNTGEAVNKILKKIFELSDKKSK